MAGLALASVVLVVAQHDAPPVVETVAPAAVSLGSMTVVNHGLVGVGRLSVDRLDAFGDTLGSVSGLQITNWARRTDGSYAGTVNILPDRGFNAGTFYADYAARINQVDFVFRPHDDGTPIGGATDLEKLRAQSQIVFASTTTGTRFSYEDSETHVATSTTGLDPADGVAHLFGRVVPYVRSYTGPATPGAETSSTWRGINRLAVDAEALALRSDGSGYLGDEYGPNVYYFDAARRITGAIVPPAAIQPHRPAGMLNFSSIAPPIDGRRNNQGIEGVALSPNGTRLFVALQSATVQDGDAAANDQRARHTRVLVYDVSASPTPDAPIAEYVLSLPIYASAGHGDANRTAAQSEIVALDDTHLLVLARDANGLGSPLHNPSVYKRVLLVDLAAGAPTNFAGDAARNAEGGRVTMTPGVLDPSITPLRWVDAIDLLDRANLGRFNVALDDDGTPSATSVSKLTLSEKWEGMALVPAHDADHPDDVFLFVANDNDFLTSAGRMTGPGGASISYDGFQGYPQAGTPAGNRISRVPPPLDHPASESDTLFLVYRLTIRSTR